MRGVLDRPMQIDFSGKKGRPDLLKGNCRNLLLGSLGSEDLSLLSPYLERVTFSEGEILSSPEADRQYSLFPECGILSIVDPYGDIKSDVAMIGHEGFTNYHLLLGCAKEPFEVVAKVGGRAFSLSSAILVELCSRRAAANSVFLNYIVSLNMQMGRNLSSNLRDPIETRLARLLLMCQDRTHGNEIQIMHRHIARMLGVRRATITDATHILEGERAIRCERGRIIIRDRLRLKEIAGASYGQAEWHYSNAIAPFGDALEVRSPSLRAGGPFASRPV